MPTANAITAPDRARVTSAIADAASRSGVDFGYLYNQARIESSLNPDAHASTSSAAGLYQFTRQTWLQTVRGHGAAHGLGWAASAITGHAGSLHVADPQLATAIDKLRLDPAVAAQMAGDLAADNGDQLSATLGRAPDPVDLYLAHFLGAQGAGRFLQAFDADPDAAAAPLFPAAAASNRSVFYASDGSARSLGQIRAGFAARFDGSVPDIGTVAAAPPPMWTVARHDASAATTRRPLAMASFDAIPRVPSADFAARAYQRLAETAS